LASTANPRGEEASGAFYLTLVPIRPRSRGARRSLRTFPPAFLSAQGPSVSIPTHLDARLSTPPDAFQLHPDVRSYVWYDPKTRRGGPFLGSRGRTPRGAAEEPLETRREVWSVRVVRSVATFAQPQRRRVFAGRQKRRRQRRRRRRRRRLPSRRARAATQGGHEVGLPPRVGGVRAPRRVRQDRGHGGEL
jgi:hypothetical protein